MQKDEQILEGLRSGFTNRAVWEKVFYQKFDYFIQEGQRKYPLTREESFSAYSDAVLAAIHNIADGKFDGYSSLKTYLYKVFSNKCIDLSRKNSINKATVNQTTLAPELLGLIPDKARTIIESMITEQKRNTIREYLDKIGKKCKDLLLYFEDGLTDKEIAEKLSYNNAAVVKTTRLRCIGKMKEQMQAILKQI